MQGLLLTKYFLIYRQFLAYLTLGVVASIGSVIFDLENARFMVVQLLLILSIVAPVELLKKEHLSGFNIYTLTLPVTRQMIVRSQYILFVLSALIGVVIIFLLSLWVSTFNDTFMLNQMLPTIIRSLSLVLIVGSLVYPLNYILGYERVEGAIFVAGFVALTIPAYIVSSAIEFKEIYLSFLPIETNTLMIILYILMALASLSVSYVMTQQIFQKKEY